MTRSHEIDALLERLAQTLRGRVRQQGAPADHPAVPAAVLVLLVPRGDDLALVLTRRPESLKTHAGQVAFPGGRKGPEDTDAVSCALRETREELGIDPAAVEVLGLLDDVFTPTGFVVTPVVGVLRVPQAYRPSPEEVAETYEVSLRELQDPARYRNAGVFVSGGVEYALHEYHCEACVVWGATARMVHQLLDVWKVVLEEDRSQDG